MHVTMPGVSLYYGPVKGAKMDQRTRDEIRQMTRDEMALYVIAHMPPEGRETIGALGGEDAIAVSLWIMSVWSQTTNTKQGPGAMSRARVVGQRWAVMSDAAKEVATTLAEAIDEDTASRAGAGDDR